MVEHLSSMSKAPSSCPNTTKPKTKNNKNPKQNATRVVFPSPGLKLLSVSLSYVSLPPPPHFWILHNLLSNLIQSPGRAAAPRQACLSSDGTVLSRKWHLWTRKQSPGCSVPTKPTSWAFPPWFALAHHKRTICFHP